MATIRHEFINQEPFWVVFYEGWPVAQYKTKGAAIMYAIIDLNTDWVVEGA